MISRNLSKISTKVVRAGRGANSALENGEELLLGDFGRKRESDFGRASYGLKKERGTEEVTRENGRKSVTAENAGNAISSSSRQEGFSRCASC